MSRPGTAATWGLALAVALLAACAPAAEPQRPETAGRSPSATGAAPEASASGLSALSSGAGPTADAAPTQPATDDRPAAEPTPAEPTPEPTPAALPVAGPAVAMPMFTSSVSGITPELAERMSASWRPGCPVPLADLRYLTVSHVTFDGGVALGELVVHADVADGLVEVFATLFAERYPIRLMRLVDDYGADDTASMDADNTSAFNCRAVTGGTRWSEHAYGRAIDLNPVENPYVVGRHVAPQAGRAYADRPDLPGVLHDGDVVVAAFAAAGWQWGGHWDSPIDYQHFSVSGR